METANTEQNRKELENIFMSTEGIQAELDDLRDNLDLDQRVLDDLKRSAELRKSIGFSKEDEGYYLTVPEVLLKFMPSLLLEVGQEQTFKTDGAVDELKYFNETTDPATTWIYVPTQRTEEIEYDYILDKLTEKGGFLHKLCTITMIIHEKYNIKTNSDGMHRSIFAYLCNVKNARANTVSSHAPDATLDQIQQNEYEVFYGLNGEGNKVSIESMSAIQSELGIETPENQLMDKFFTEAGIHYAKHGVPTSETKLVYTVDKTVLINLLATPQDKDPKSKGGTKCFYVGVKKWREYKDFIVEIAPDCRTKVHAALASVFSRLPADEVAFFKKFLKVKNFNENDQIWSQRNVTNAAVETICFRLGILFNEWYRDIFGSNVLDSDWFNHYLVSLSNENVHTCQACLNGVKFIIEEEDTEEDE